MQSRRWLGTWFPVGVNNEDPGPDVLDFARYYVGAIETCPKTGKLHVQFYVFLKQKKTLKGAVSLFHAIGWQGVHLDACRGTHEECITYIKGPYDKDGKVKPARTDYNEYGPVPSDSRKGDKWQQTLQLAQAGRFGEIDPSIQITQFRNLRYVFSDQNRAEDRDHPTGVWIYGQAGAGKSTMARNFGPYFDKDCNKWWCGYRNEPVVIIDDLGPTEARGMDRFLKIWGDRFAFTPEIKGHHLGKIRPEYIIVTSQYKIEDLFPDPETQAALFRRYERIRIHFENGTKLIDRTPRSVPAAAEQEEVVPPQPVDETFEVGSIGLPEIPMEELSADVDVGELGDFELLG